VFTLAGGEQLFIGAVSDRQFVTLCKVLEQPELAEDPALKTNAMRVAVRPALVERLGAILKGHRADELSAKLEAAGLPYAPIARPEQLLDDPHLKASGGLAPMQCGEGASTEVVLLPLLMNGRRLPVRQPLAGIGEHTDEVLGRLGLKSAEEKR
jgi:crotonobetainyl-CoA:carnitine CoA-transferase CaiB-like acyl-CoA transferase